MLQTLIQAGETSVNVAGHPVGPFSPQNQNSAVTAGRLGDFAKVGASITATQDAANWADLASARGLRLPQHETPCTTGRMERWLRKLGLSHEWFTEWIGYRRLGDWIAATPGWNLRAFLGLLLEEG